MTSNSKLKIGNLSLNSKVLSAPMLDVSDYPYRAMCREYGAEFTTTEMVSPLGIVDNDFLAVKMATISPDEHPIGVQLLGKDPSVFAEASIILETRGADAIVINGGCSVSQVCQLGFGAALLDDLKKFARIIETTKKSLKSIPLVVKTRPGKNQAKIVINELVKLMQNSGADALVVHGRTRNMEYAEPANWNWIKIAKEQASIPIIGNGDIYSYHDADKMLKETGCDGLMVARGGIGNPFIFREINQFFNNEKEINKPTFKEIFGACNRHIELILREKGEIIGIKTARRFIMYYFKSFNFAELFKKEIFKIDDITKLKEFLLEQQNYYQNLTRDSFETELNFERFKEKTNYWLVNDNND